MGLGFREEFLCGLGFCGCCSVEHEAETVLYRHTQPISIIAVARITPSLAWKLFQHGHALARKVQMKGQGCIVSSAGNLP